MERQRISTVNPAVSLASKRRETMGRHLRQTRHRNRLCPSPQRQLLAASGYCPTDAELAVHLRDGGLVERFDAADESALLRSVRHVDAAAPGDRRNKPTGRTSFPTLDQTNPTLAPVFEAWRTQTRRLHLFRGLANTNPTFTPV